jgi:hypothetical protein
MYPEVLEFSLISEAVITYVLRVRNYFVGYMTNYRQETAIIVLFLFQIH